MKDIVLKKVMHVGDTEDCYFNYMIIAQTFDGRIVEFESSGNLPTHLPWTENKDYVNGQLSAYYMAIRGSRVMRKYVYSARWKTKCRKYAEIRNMSFLSEDQVFDYLL